MDKSALPTIFLALFPFLFVGMWCGVVLLLSGIGGWGRLAQGFAANRRPNGRRLTTQSGKVGGVNYNSCLTVHVAEDGLYLSVMVLFRLGHPPLFIPWSSIHNRTVRRFLWIETVKFEVGSPTVATLQLSKKVFEGRGEEGDQSARAVIP